MKLNRIVKKDKKDSIIGTLVVLGIAFAMAGVIGFLIMTNIIVVAPIAIGMVAGGEKKGIKDKWKDTSRSQKITLTTVVLLLIPIIITGLLWLFVGASDFLIDALIIVPIFYLAIWFFWGRKQKVANYAEEGGMFEGGAGTFVKKAFGNQLVAVVCLIILIGILIFAGVSFNTDSNEKSSSADMANTKGGITNPIVPQTPSTAVNYLNTSENNGGNASLPSDPTIDLIENSYDMMNITVFAYDPYIASYRYIDAGKVGRAYEITNYAQNYTYLESTSTLVYGAQGVRMISMPNTKITLYGATGSKIASNTTDADGKCYFNNVLIGVYTMEWSKPAYATTKAKIDLGELVGEDATPMKITTTETKVSSTLNETQYIYNYFYYTPTKEVYAPLKPTGMSVEVTFIASSTTVMENTTMPAKEYLTASAQENVPSSGVDFIDGITNWASGVSSDLSYDVGSAMGLTNEEPVVIGTQNTTTFTVWLIPRLFSANEISTIRNIERQQSMWGWSALPNQVGLQNGILSSKQSMQSMFNSMWGGLQSTLPYMQSIGATYAAPAPEGQALTYKSHSVKVLSSYISSTNEIGETTTYVPIVLQKNTMNTVSGSQDPYAFELSTNGGSSVLIARPYRFYVIMPKGGDLTMDFEVSVNFVRSSLGIITTPIDNDNPNLPQFETAPTQYAETSVWGETNETYTFTQSLTFSSTFDPMGANAYTGTTVEDANTNVLTAPPEDGVETPVEAGVEDDLYPFGISP